MHYGRLHLMMLVVVKKNIRKGIIDTIIEQGFSMPYGSYVLEDIKVSEQEPYESVPIAFYWASQ